MLLRLIAVLYAVAFTSLLLQVKGLSGADGIFPARSWLEFFSGKTPGFERFFIYPTIFWLQSQDAWLIGGCIAGIAASLCAAAGLLPLLFFAVCFILYLSYYTVCGPFLHFQWDLLLLECGFLAMLAAPSARYEAGWTLGKGMVFVFRFLLFKLMFFSGLCKWTSHDATWATFNALHFHYLTQPLPPWTAWYFHHLPDWIQRVSVFAVMVIECIFPWLIWGPQRARRTALVGFIFLQSMIVLTGNFGFFNLLSGVLCLSLWDAAPNHPKRPGIFRGAAEWRKIGIAGFGILYVPISLYLGVTRWVENAPRLPVVDQCIVGPLQSWPAIGTYGLFSVMTTERREIVIEGSDDGVEWKEYEFRWKPGDVLSRPRFSTPHMPRLDWQMWFAALGTWRDNPWLMQFCQRILEGSSSSLKLLKTDPFHGHQPKYLRMLLYQYEFTDDLSGPKPAWWTRKLIGAYSPIISLRNA